MNTLELQQLLQKLIEERDSANLKSSNLIRHYRPDFQKSNFYSGFAEGIDFCIECLEELLKAN
ncbi:MAG: hypothetical protein MUF43_06705 [Flavobacterium sp.]|jgi:hypothetical protein|nr:hypothetical protein [Flavobacterium sp.]